MVFCFGNIHLLSGYWWRDYFSTFKKLYPSKTPVFDRGIINVFKGLSWDYKTNSPCFFGKNDIMNNLGRTPAVAIAWRGDVVATGWQIWNGCCFCWMAKRYPIHQARSPCTWWSISVIIRIGMFITMLTSPFATFKRALHISRSNALNWLRRWMTLLLSIIRVYWRRDSEAIQ